MPMTTTQVSIDRIDSRPIALRHDNGAWDWEATYRITVPNVARPTVVRVRLHWDSSYAFQSYAIADLFDAERQAWNELTRVTGAAVARLAWTDGTEKLASGYAPRFDYDRAANETDAIATKLVAYAQRVTA